MQQDCNVDADGMLELEGIDTAVLIAFYKDCDRITLFRTEMLAMSVNAKIASKLFVAMGQYAAAKNSENSASI